MSNPASSHPELRSAGDDRFDNLLRVIVTTAAAVALLGACVLGISYLATSITHRADYSDSGYYLSGAYRWLGFHANRGVVYPPLVYLWHKKLALPLATLHGLQVVCVLAALTLFVRRLADWASCDALKRLPVCFALAVAGLTSSPLLLHHALSVMPDALATTMMLCVTVAVVDGLRAGDELRWSRRLLFLGLAGLGCSLVRNEHAYIVLAFSLATGTLYAMLAPSWRARRNVLVHCGVFWLGVAASMATTGAIQRASPKTDEASLPQMLAINRLSWGALPAIAPHLEEKTKLLLGDIDKLDEHPHNLPKRYEKLLVNGVPQADVEAAFDDVLSKSIEYDWHNFTTRYYRDWLRHFVLDISYPMSVPDGRGGPRPGFWTYTRTVDHARSAKLVNIWIAASQGLFWALLAGAALGARSRAWKLTPQVLLGTVGIVFFCASLYATLTPNFNPRYGLPAAAVGHMTLLTLAASIVIRRK